MGAVWLSIKVSVSVGGVASEVVLYPVGSSLDLCKLTGVGFSVPVFSASVVPEKYNGLETWVRELFG